MFDEAPQQNVRSLTACGRFVAALLIVMGIIAACDEALVAAEPFDPGKAIKATIDVIERSSIATLQLDDALSQQWFAAFLDRLDPRRMYFLDSDRREFAPFERRLDDLAQAESMEFAHIMRERLRQRVAEAVKVAERYIGEDHDYSLDESIPHEFDFWSATADELRERWRLRIKLEMLIEKTYGRPQAEVRMQLADRYQRNLRQAREMDDDRLGAIYLNTLLSCIDPHACYLSPNVVASMQTSLVRVYQLEFAFRESDGRLLLTAPLRPESALARPRELQLIAIRRRSGAVLDVVEMPAEDFRDMTRSCAGPLGDDAEVVLELMDPTSHRRLAVDCGRYPWRP